MRIACFDLAMKESGNDKETQASQIIQAFRDEGIKLSAVVLDQPNPESPLPKSFDENWSFVDDDLNNGKGGGI